MVRTFIAVESSQEQKEKIGKVIERFRQELGQKGTSYVKPENLHVTMRFLGDLSQSEIEKVKLGCEQVVQGIGQFNLSLKGLGAFPDLNYIRVLWVGAEAGKAEMVRLREKIDHFVKVGKKDSKGFSAHVTFARVKFLKDKNRIRELLEEFEQEEFGEVVVKEIVVKKSTLTPQGAVYEDLASFCFSSLD